MKPYKIGYTAGAFDVFHPGHLNLLENAKSMCDFLIVGVTGDKLIEETKGHKPVISEDGRIRIIRALRCVDMVVLQDDLDKVKAWNTLRYDVLFSGSDWQNSERWKGYERELKKRNVDVVYFPYTESISSTVIRQKTEENNRD